MRSAVLLTLALCCAAAAEAGEVWVVRGETVPQCPANVNVWLADALLFADPDVGGDVHVLDVSNGGTVQEDTFPLLPGRALSLRMRAHDQADSVVWITHLSVPDGTVVDSRLTYVVDECRGIPRPIEPFTKVQMPVFHALVPPGKRQIHTGSDLGAQAARVNVGVYNAGFVSAEAQITVRRPNCDVAPATMALAVPARTLLQTSIDPPAPCAVMYPGSFTLTEVTVSEPSLSYAVTLSNAAPPTATIGFASPSNGS